MQTLSNHRRVWQVRLSYPTAVSYGVLDGRDYGAKVEGVTVWDVVTGDVMMKIKFRDTGDIRIRLYS